MDWDKDTGRPLAIVRQDQKDLEEATIALNTVGYMVSSCIEKRPVGYEFVLSGAKFKVVGYATEEETIAFCEAIPGAAFHAHGLFHHKIVSD